MTTLFQSWRSFFAALILAVLSSFVLIYANPTFVKVDGIGEGPKRVLTKQPYTVPTPKHSTGAIILDISYSPGENTTFVFEPESYNAETANCIRRLTILTLPNHAPPVLNIIPVAKFCQAVTLNLAPYLKDGINKIFMEVETPASDIIVYVTPKLFGAHMLSTLGCIGLFVAASIVMFNISRTLGLTVGTALIAACGVLYLALPIWLRPHLEYTADLPGHIPYIQHMVDRWLHPYNYNGHENFHPPTYYFLAARIYTLFDAPGIVNPLAAVRALSLAIYMIFCLYGLRTLNEAVERKGAAFYIGCIWIVFWPLSNFMATNITNDVATYPLWAASFYYMTRYFRERNLRDMQWSVALIGITFMIKSNALVPAGIIGVCGIYALLSRQLTWRQLFLPGSLVAFGVAVLGLVVNTGRIIYRHFAHGSNEVMGYFGYPRTDVYPLSYYLGFDVRDFIAHPYTTFMPNEPSFLNYMLKTAVHPPWNHPGYTVFPGILNGLWIGLLVFILCGTAVYSLRNRRYAREAVPYIIAMIVSVLGVVGFTLVERYQHCQNFRYILPALVPIVILFVQSADAMRSTLILRPIYWLGLIAVLSLVIGAAILFASIYMPIPLA